MIHSREHLRSRRRLLRQMAGISMGLPLAPWLDIAGLAQKAATPGTQHKDTAAPQTPFSPEEEQFLDDLERSNFLFFWEQASPQTGLIKDRCNARTTDTSVVASVASTGFGLTAICIAEKRGFIPHQAERIAGSTIPLPTSTPGRESGTPRFLRSIRPFCFAEYLPAAGTLTIATLSS